MSEHEQHEDPVDVEALGWDVPEPPEGFAKGVADALAEEDLEQARPEGERKLKPVWIAGIVGVAAAALLWAVSVWPTASTVSDSVTAEAIQTVDIHERAIAVAQPGAELHWDVEADGTAHVQQGRGSVFYRVNDGRPFEVKTPAGTVTVTGTCFEVELIPMKKSLMSKQGVKAGAIGAALASAVLVTVYEGQVVLANERGEVTVDAGHKAKSSSGSAPSAWGDDDEGRMADAPADSGTLSIPAGTDPIATVRSQAQSIERLRAEKLDQTEEIERLRAQVTELGGTPEGLGPEAKKARARKCAQQSRNGDCPFLDPDQETLEEMARCGTVKYDYPSFLDEADVPQTAGYAQKLGLESKADRDAFQAAAERHHERYTSAVRNIYLELGGDPEMAQDMSPNTMEAFIEDQFDRELVASVQRKVAEERAGMREPPAADAELPLEERFWRLRAELGNDFEGELSEALGPERARELRHRNDGWPGSTSVHSSDCR